MDLEKIRRENERMMEATGGIFYNSYLTPREHQMIGSGVEEHYWNKPDMPLCVFDREVSPEYCDSSRQNSEKAITIREKIGLLELNLDKKSFNYGTTIKDK